MTDHLDESSRPKSNAAPWLIALGFAIGVFLLTNSPLLAAIYPYLRAGWPAFATGCWLRRVDPWPARGRAAFHFHLAMAGFRAGIAGLLSVVLIALLEQSLQRPADISAVILALSAIMGGVVTSFLFGWLGIITAVRHRVRVFIVSNLKDRCHGDFTQIATLPWRETGLNPVTLVAAVAIVVPMLAVWFIAMLAFTVPQPGGPNPEPWLLPMLGLCLLVIPILCVLILAYVSARIIARSPHECWGAEPPIEATDPWAAP
jgi:hypothetical protein